MEVHMSFDIETLLGWFARDEEDRGDGQPPEQAGNDAVWLDSYLYERDARDEDVGCKPGRRE
jgi:hypothetical protein